MDMRFSDADLAFQQEVRGFIRDRLPDAIRRKVRDNLHLTKDDFVAWQRILNERGWLVPGWPREHGGQDWTPTQHFLFQKETADGNCPPVIPFGPNMVAPVIYTFGSEEQKERFLPRIRTTEDWWCQGYSEPGSGSDLASLQCKAERDGEHYVVNGQKTWTTLAQYADWIFCLVRTSREAKPQEGISFLLIDMKSAGISVDPIITIDGGHEVNSVFFQDVRVPVQNLVGEENKGWTYAKFLLGYERSNTLVPTIKRQFAKLKRIAGTERSDAAPLADDRGFAREMADFECQLLAYEFYELRSLAARSKGQPPGFEASVLKVRGTELQQAVSEMLLKAIAYYGNPYLPETLQAGWNEAPIGPDYAAPLAPQYFNWRKTSIYAGSNEIQRNILSKMVLGM